MYGRLVGVSQYGSDGVGGDHKKKQIVLLKQGTNILDRFYNPIGENTASCFNNAYRTVKHFVVNNTIPYIEFIYD